MKTVYLITAFVGEYDDYSEWPVVSCLSKDKAEELVNTFNEANVELKKEYNEANVYVPWGEDRDAYYEQVEAVHNNLIAICNKHPASPYTDRIDLSAKYTFEELKQVDQ